MVLVRMRHDHPRQPEPVPGRCLRCGALASDLTFDLVVQAIREAAHAPASLPLLTGGQASPLLVGKRGPDVRDRLVLVSPLIPLVRFTVHMVDRQLCVITMNVLGPQS